MPQKPPALLHIYCKFTSYEELVRTRSITSLYSELTQLI